LKFKMLINPYSRHRVSVSIIIKVFLYIGFLYISTMTSAVKTSFVLPEPLYRELKRRALEEGRTVKEVVIEAIMNYLSASRSRRKDLVELADKMVKYGIARSRFHAISLMIRHGISKVAEEVSFWEELYSGVEELKRENFRISHGDLSRLLQGERNER